MKKQYILECATATLKNRDKYLKLQFIGPALGAEYKLVLEPDEATIFDSLDEGQYHLKKLLELDEFTQEKQCRECKQELNRPPSKRLTQGIEFFNFIDSW